MPQSRRVASSAAASTATRAIIVVNPGPDASVASVFVVVVCPASAPLDPSSVVVVVGDRVADVVSVGVSGSGGGVVRSVVVVVGVRVVVVVATSSGVTSAELSGVGVPVSAGKLITHSPLVSSSVTRPTQVDVFSA